MGLIEKRFHNLGTVILIVVTLGILAYNVSFVLKLPDFSPIKDQPKTIRSQITRARTNIYLFPSSQNFGYLGMVFQSNAFYKEASQCYKLAIQKNAKNPKWRYLLGYLDLENGDNQEALANFKEVIRIEPSNFMAVYYSGESAQRLNQPNEAEKYFLKVLSFNDQTLNSSKSNRENYFPVKIYAKFDLARIYLESNRLEEAEKILKEVVIEKATFGPAFRLLGTLYSRKGDPELGAKYTTRAKDYADYTPPADPLTDELLLISRSDLSLLKGIDLAIKYGNFQWAVKLCNHSLQYLSDNKFLLSKAIKVYTTAGDEGLALKLAERHLRFFENDPRELIDMADFFMSKGQVKMGLVYFSAAKKLKPEDPILPVWLLKWKYYNGAEKVMKEQLHKSPDNARFLSNAVNVSMGNNKSDTAAIYLAKLTKLYPSDPDVKRFSGYLALKKSNYAEAINDWKETLKNDPKDISLINNLNRIYHQRQMWMESKNLLQQSLQDNPNDPMLLDEFGNLLLQCPEENIRNIDEGREYCERAYNSYYYNFDVHISSSKNLATAYAILGDKKSASKYLNITLDLATENTQKEYKTWAEDLKKKYDLPTEPSPIPATNE